MSLRASFSFLIPLIILSTIFISCSAATPGKHNSQFQALIIGINDYQDAGMVDLDGAVNDAELLYTSLQTQIGINKNNIIKLTNKAADKNTIRNSWQQLIDNAAPGSTLIFSFSGHGYQEPDHNGDEALRDPGDKEDEVLLLGGFSTQNTKQLAERIIDDELAVWFKAAEKKNLRVIYLADTCYSGDSSRNVELGKARGLQLSETDQAELQAILAQNALPQSKQRALVQKGLYTFSSTGEDQLAQERIAKGKAHGMLSWFFAKALKYADSNGNQALSHAELADYLDVYIRINSNGTMTPELLPANQIAETFLPLSNPIDAADVWPVEMLSQLYAASPLDSGFYQNTGGKLIKAEEVFTEDKVFFKTANPKYPYVYQFAATITPERLVWQCFPPKVLTSIKRNIQTAFFATPPVGKQFLMNLAVEKPDQQLDSLFVPQYCQLNAAKLKNLPILLEKTPYQIGIAKTFIFR